ncbi:MAG: replicative DNA helicase [Candidatus Staskawiczbacteria bacterium RIFCSPLOWO2_01_FULL_40_39]|uniref:Replicative DNA helicase n=1 Tax=Candidatus Staskawiczbacteria bacterium RIFCSPHIGHO2_01_FULL_39_25 TaxID=1802202 RepID=A0A1G2HQD0_9BACT|nr:MAG: replicative DNA helicase [Candidatus Staskawiczbacteria bacterium RIFCSPHIGHO2_01_FULL_39_25]OGZ72884.1 MAG: replicative DNA helicase [Candidatus Staskawiczbacteria bacterium RIFCSPLOWO2_01_FULL_40_39]
MMVEMPAKKPPQNIEAEQCLLGCLMLDKNAIIRVSDFIDAEDFYKDLHKEIYAAMVGLFEKMEPIDIISVSTKLREREKLEQIGGSAYLTSLINTVPTATHVANYAKIVREKKVLRDLIEASHEIGLDAFDESQDVDVLLDKAEKRVFSIGQKSLTQAFIPIKDILGETFERIDQLSKHQGDFRGIPTGFRQLDNLLAGLQRSDLVILAARPSMGKSSMALDIAKNIAVFQNLPVGIFSLEMSKDQIVDRMIASQANIDLWKLRTGKLQDGAGDNDFSRIQSAMGTLSEAPIYIDDMGTTNIMQMRAMARRLQADTGLGLIIVDYLQLMDTTNKYATPIQQVTENSRALKSLAKELNIPVLVLSQLSRKVEERTPHRPMLSDLRESGAIEQDADVVMFIYREDKYNENSLEKNIAEIMIAKHRNGPTGAIKLYFDEPRASFRNLEQGDYVTEVTGE